MKNNSLERLLALSALGLLLAGMLIGCGRSQPESRRYREIVYTGQTPAPNAPASTQRAASPSMDGGLPPGHPMLANPAPSGMSTEQLPPSLRGGADVQITWSSPDGWEEAVGQGMRLASFTLPEAPEEMLVTLIALSGPAGGLSSNVGRWLGQVNVVRTQNELDSLVEALPRFTTPAGIDGVWVDFNPFVAPEADSVKAAILTVGGSTVFVKMTGSASVLEQQEERLRSLADSIQPRTES